MKKTSLTLSEVIVSTSTRMKVIANRFVFSPSGITGSKFCILRMLHFEGAQRPGAITKFTGGTKSNVSQRINALEDEGFVIRSRSKKGDDRRNVSVEITPKGKKLVSKLMEKFNKAAVGLQSQFSEIELKNHFAFFEKMNRLLDEHAEELPKLFQK